MAPGREGIEAGEAELRDYCNVGYAKGCPHLPVERKADVVRFAVARDGGRTLSLHWVTEREHLPVEHGTLEYDAIAQCWTVAHENACVQRMAECYMETYVARHPRQQAVGRPD
jgi:hypothetical protein